MVELNPTILIITLSVKGLNPSIKRQRVDKKASQSLLYSAFR